MGYFYPVAIMQLIGTVMFWVTPSPLGADVPQQGYTEQGIMEIFLLSHYMVQVHLTSAKSWYAPNTPPYCQQIHNSSITDLLHLFVGFPLPLPMQTSYDQVPL